MANIKVSELPSASSFGDSDYTMIVQSGENKKIAKQNMAIPKITKIWEDNTVTTWHDATLGLDVSNYDFLLIVSSQQTSFVPSFFDLYLTWNGYYTVQSKDVITQRHIYRDGNDIHWGECFYRGINGATGVGNADDIDYPRTIYGIKI